MKLLMALGSGLAGALALTLLHETGRRVIPEAPRMDILGMRVIARTMNRAGQPPPTRERLHSMALAGDIAGNALYYSLVGAGAPGSGAWLRGGLLGLLAGLGGVFLPSSLGLGSGPSSRTRQTQALTVLWYLVGGLAAAAAHQIFSELDEDRRWM